MNVLHYTLRNNDAKSLTEDTEKVPMPLTVNIIISKHVPGVHSTVGDYAHFVIESVDIMYMYLCDECFSTHNFITLAKSTGLDRCWPVGTGG